jgi:hypothetical protein
MTFVLPACMRIAKLASETSASPRLRKHLSADRDAVSKIRCVIMSQTNCLEADAPPAPTVCAGDPGFGPRLWLRHRAGTSERQNDRVSHPRPCTPRPCPRRPAFPGCGSGRLLRRPLARNVTCDIGASQRMLESCRRNMRSSSLSNLENSAFARLIEHGGIDKGAVDVGKGAGPTEGPARS